MYEITDEASLRHAINDFIRFYSTERPQDTPLKVRNEAMQSDQVQAYPIAQNKRIGFLDTESLFIDGIHIKASVNSHKY